MPNRTSTGPKPIFSASNARTEIAASLQNIKDTLGYTDEDLARVLGKSEDMARAYRRGDSGMDAFSLLAAWREWNGAFIGPIRRFVEGSRPTSVDDRIAQHQVLNAATALSEALSCADELDDEAIRKNRAALEKGRDALDALLGKIGPKVAA